MLAHVYIIVHFSHASTRVHAYFQFITGFIFLDNQALNVENEMIGLAINYMYSLIHELTLIDKSK